MNEEQAVEIDVYSRPLGQKIRIPIIGGARDGSETTMNWPPPTAVHLGGSMYNLHQTKKGKLAYVIAAP